MATINAYLYWIKFFIRYHRLRHPAELGEPEVQQFLTHLASERHVAAKTQAQALNALVFLYKSILRHPLALEMRFQHSSKSPRLPCVLTQSEVRSLLLVITSYSIHYTKLYDSRPGQHGPRSNERTEPPPR